jgi:hypothetical protein
MDTIANLLENRSFEEPPEIKIIKKFVRDNFDEECLVKVSKFRITIYVPNAALAGALKDSLRIMKSQLNTPKTINIIIAKI